MKFSFLVACSLAFLIGCPKNPVAWPPFEPDGGADLDIPPLGTCENYCANLAKLGCLEAVRAEGGGRSCESTCTAATLSKYDLRLACVASAEDPDSVRACCPDGTLGCSSTRCAGK